MPVTLELSTITWLSAWLLDFNHTQSGVNVFDAIFLFVAFVPVYKNVLKWSSAWVVVWGPIVGSGKLAEHNAK